MYVAAGVIQLNMEPMVQITKTQHMFFNERSN